MKDLQAYISTQRWGGKAVVNVPIVKALIDDAWAAGVEYWLHAPADAPIPDTWDEAKRTMHWSDDWPCPRDIWDHLSVGIAKCLEGIGDPIADLLIGTIDDALMAGAKYGWERCVRDTTQLTIPFN